MSSPHKKRSLNDVNDDFNQPPFKKQKIDNNQHSNTNCDKMNNFCCDIIEMENKALILFSGSMSNDRINNFCRDIIEKNEFKIIQRKEIITSHEILENVFFNSHSSTIDECDIINIGMYNEFLSSSSFSVILISNNNSNMFYQQLNILTQLYASNSKQALNHIYITLNYFDYLFKYEILFSDSKLKLFTNRRINLEEPCDIIQMQLNKGGGEYVKEIKCCCLGITMYLNTNYTNIYNGYIKEYGYNKIAKQSYYIILKNICMEWDIEFQCRIMNILWSIVGDIIHYKIDKCQMINYKCNHCNDSICVNINHKLQLMALNELYLNNLELQKQLKNTNNVTHTNVNKNKTKSKENIGQRLCDVCNVSVPSAEKNWTQHVNGKKHQKKLKKQQNDQK